MNASVFRCVFLSVANKMKELCTMKETTSPLYFLLSDETIHFEIVNDGETVEIERTNQSTLLKTNVEKSG